MSSTIHGNSNSWTYYNYNHTQLKDSEQKKIQEPDLHISLRPSHVSRRFLPLLGEVDCILINKFTFCCWVKDRNVKLMNKRCKL